MGRELSQLLGLAHDACYREQQRNPDNPELERVHKLLMEAKMACATFQNDMEAKARGWPDNWRDQG